MAKIQGTFAVRKAPEDGGRGESITIVNKEVVYAVGKDGVNHDGLTWYSTVQAAGNGEYLWTRSTLWYSDGTSITTYSVARQGTDGKGIKETWVAYSLQPENVDAEAIAEDQWGAFPIELLEGYWLYTRTKILYTDGEVSIGYSVSYISETMSQLFLENQSDTIIYDEQSKNISGSVSSTVELYEGSRLVKDATDWQIDASSTTATEVTLADNGDGTWLLTVGGLNGMNGIATVMCRYKNRTHRATMTVKKIINANKYQLVVVPDTLTYKKGANNVFTIYAHVYVTTPTGERKLSAPPAGYKTVLSVNDKQLIHMASESATSSFNVSTDELLERYVVTLAKLKVDEAGGSVIDNNNVLDMQTVPCLHVKDGEIGESLTIVAEKVMYAAGNSGVSHDGLIWQDTVPEVPAGMYLWTRCTVRYSDGTETTTYSVARQGENGEAGITFWTTPSSVSVGLSNDGSKVVGRQEYNIFVKSRVGKDPSVFVSVTSVSNRTANIAEVLSKPDGTGYAHVVYEDGAAVSGDLDGDIEIMCGADSFTVHVTYLRSGKDGEGVVVETDPVIMRKSEWEIGKDYNDGTVKEADGYKYLDYTSLSKTDNTAKYYICKQAHRSLAEHNTGSLPLNLWMEVQAVSPIKTPFAEISNAVIQFLQTQRITLTDNNGKVYGSFGGGVDYPLWFGAETAEAAPFKVDKNGNATIKGIISAKAMYITQGGLTTIEGKTYIDLVNPENTGNTFYIKEGKVYLPWIKGYEGLSLTVVMNEGTLLVCNTDGVNIESMYTAAFTMQDGGTVIPFGTETRYLRALSTTSTITLEAVSGLGYGNGNKPVWIITSQRGVFGIGQSNDGSGADSYRLLPDGQLLTPPRQ